MAVRHRRRWRLGLALGPRRQDQIGPPEAREEKIVSRPFVILCSAIAAVAIGAACGPRRIVLPAGAGVPTAEYSAAWASTLMRCHDVRTLQAELSLSGRAGQQRLRGRVLAGFAPGALRLEAVAPFGSPVFILVADGLRGTLLLLRDRRVLTNAPPAEMLNALVGVRLGPDDLRAVLSGCVKADAEATSGLAYGPNWMRVELASGGTAFLQRQPAGWRLVAGRYSDLEIEYPRFAGELPAQVVIRSTPTGGAADVNVMVALSQVEVNVDLPRDQLVAVKIPPELTPITLDELRRSGPLGR